MSDSKQVKVDNWGVYFLQRLKHFFNRTDYCDLTLQFQDNAQLKVHRLVLNACTEYFEILERTCEMYEDCLIMPDDLQADVVVPIVNFMYTGQLEFKPELLEKLYQTSHVMNMPVLTKLLEAQRKRTIPAQVSTPVLTTKQHPPKRFYNKAFDSPKTLHSAPKKPYILPHTSKEKSSSQQVYYKNPKTKEIIMVNKPKAESTPRIIPTQRQSAVKSKITTRYTEPKPTRYEVPEELDPETLYDDSFTDLSYESRPLMIHPETSKRYQRKKNSFGIFSDASTSKNNYASSSLDIVECKKIVKDQIFEDPYNDIHQNNDFDALKKSPEASVSKLSSFFDEESVTTAPKVFIEGKESNTKNIDHAKIISEVLKKYPHLMKKNKNIKLKILDAPPKGTTKIQSKKQPSSFINNKTKVKQEKQFESEVLDSKEAARLIALGAENVSGPWICLICGAPGKALNFVSYYKFRRHLVEVHGEKEIPSMCEYCGLKSTKRNYMLHHLYSKHGIPPPQMYNFPKCRQCDYIGLTQAILVKHEASHSDGKIYTCSSCHLLFNSSHALLTHIQKTGHKIASEKRVNHQCVYCMKTFVRESNLYAHLKTCHKKEAKRDGILECSDDEDMIPFKYEPAPDETDDSQDMQYNIEQSPDGKLQVTKAQKQKVLNQGYNFMQGPVRNLNKIQYEDNDEELEEEVPINREEITSNENELILGDTNTDGRQLYIVEQTMPIMYDDDNGGSEQNIKPAKQSNNTNQIQFIVDNEAQYKAIVSSGQPIIYDTDGSATKTLAVLTTPDASNYNQGTTIDLNNASNEMMLFQDGYPINVSESVTDNQNIVVVYSHALNNGGNQIILNAQGQIISSEGLNTQYATKAIPSVYQTEPKPEVNTNAQMDNIVWQGNNAADTATPLVSTNQQTIYTDTSGSQMIVPNVDYVQQHEVVQTEVNQNEHKPASDDENMDEDLPPVTMNNQILEIHQQGNNDKDDSQSNKVLPSLPQIDDSSSVQQVVHDAPSQELSSREHIKNNGKISNEDETPMDVDSSKDEMIQTNEEMPESEIIHEPESPTYTQEDSEIVPAPPPQVVAKIQNLTSEWSEDEIEEEIKNETKAEVKEFLHDEDSEETIENIQKELNKCEQRPQIVSEQIENIQPSVEEHQELIANNNIRNEPPVKINTLLNDWEENDSRDENDLNEGTELHVENNLIEGTEVQENNVSEESNTTEGMLVQEINDLHDNNKDQVENESHEQIEQEENVMQTENSLQENNESLESNEMQTENDIQEENDSQDENNCDEIQEDIPPIDDSAKPRAKSKEVSNIKSLVSDWDEDEEVK